MHPAEMLPPELVEARGEREPLEERERSVEVAELKVRELFWNRSSPANAPARPTCPIRLKSTRGRVAHATLALESSSNERGNISA